MLKSNIKTAIRHIIKNKGLSVINIFGLSVSIAICLLSYLFISFEYSHDNFHKKGDRVFQVINKLNWKVGEPFYNYLQNYKLSSDLKNDIPSIEYATGLRTCNAWIEYNNKKLYQKIAFTDSSFFDIFTFDLITGYKEGLLKNEDDVIISKGLADKLIKSKGIENYSQLIGKTIEFPDLKNRNLAVSGVLNDIPKNSSIQFDILINYKHSTNYPQASNVIGNTSVYLCLDDSKSHNNVEKIASANVKKLYPKVYKRFTKDDMVDNINNFTIELLPFKDTYLTDKIKTAYADKGDKKRSTILEYISILILILACINYVMLSIGISMKRFKEIAVKKVFGSRRINIIIQFLTETSIIVLISIILGVVLAELSIPLFNDLTGYNLDFNLYTDAFAYTFITGLFIIIVSIISIPSIYISKQNPIKIFRNSTKMGSRLGIAKSFMVIQFTLSLVLIIASVFTVKQINYMKSQDLGFRSENIITIDLPSDFQYSRKIQLQERINKLNEVLSVGAGDRNFIWGSGSTSSIIDSIQFQSRYIRIDTNYIRTLDIKLIDGRNLRETDNLKHVNNVLVNETFVKQANIKHPLEKSFIFGGYKVNIIGIVKDFHLDSMHKKIEPLVCFNNEKISYLFIQTRKGSISQTVSEIKDIWREFDSKSEIRYSFLDESLKKQYANEEQISNIVTIITILALMISVFGLMGLTMLLLIQKIKEIGIRKINGASTWQILMLINKEFGKYLLIASIIAIPISYFGLNVWLEEFALKTPLNWWIFIVSAIGLALIILLTISYKSMRAAVSNPVISIRYE